MRKRIFISFSSKDAASAKEICAFLEGQGVDCWIAPRDVAPGHNWDEEIIDAIDGSSALLLILSEHSNESVQVKHEVERAVRTGKPILPIRIQDVQPSRKLALHVSTRHWLDAWEPPLESKLTQLAAAVRRLVKAPEDSDQVTSSVGSLETSISPGPHDLSTRLRSIARSRGATVAVATVSVVLAVFIFELWRTAASSIDSIAVLPLVQGGGDQILEYQIDGITDSLIDSLTQAQGLKVISRDSAFRYKENKVDVREVGRNLDVRTVLLGRIGRQGGTLITDVELVDARDGTRIWGEQYDCPMDGISNLHHKISRDVLHQLGHSLSTEQQERLAERHQPHPEAWQLYTEGLYYWYKSSPEDNRKSGVLFRQAAESDPEFALAQLWLGHFYGYAAARGWGPPGEYWPRAEQASRKAAELDPTLPDLYNALAAFEIYRDHDWEGGEKEFEAGLRSGGSEELVNHYASYLGRIRQTGKAIELHRRALQLSPVSPRFNQTLGATYYYARRYKDAREQLRTTLQLDPKDPRTNELLGDVLAQMGYPEEAIAAWHQAILVSGDDELASLLIRTNETSGIDAAVAAVAKRRLKRLDEAKNNDKYVPAMFFVRQHLRAGHREEALLWAKKAFAERNALVLELPVDPAFDSLRDDPEFQAGVRELGLPAWTS